MEMLTRDLLFGMNALSLAGFALMFAALNLSRQPKVAKLWSIVETTFLVRTMPP